MNQIRLVALLVLAMTVGVACRGAPTAAEKKPASATPAPILSVTASRVEVMPMRSRIDLLGATAALRHVTLRAPSSGRLVGFKLQSGDRVRRGEIVGRIINRELEAAKSGLAVAQEIEPQDAASLKKSVERYTRQPGVPVKVPATAIVSQRLVSSGQTVAYLDPLANLVDPASVYVEAQVPIDAINLIKPGMNATVTSSVRPGASFRARVIAMSPSFTAASETTPVRLEFDGPQRIAIAGVPVQIHVTTRYVSDALAIPSTALFEDARTNTYYTFAVGNDGRAHRVPVVTGIRESGRVQITSGLKAGEMVITSGGYALSNGLRVKIESLPDHLQ